MYFFLCIFAISFIFEQLVTGNSAWELYGQLGQTLVELSILLLAVKIYYQFNCSFLYTMYWKHRLAFKLHSCRLISLTILTSISVTLIIFKDIWWLFIFSCDIEHYNAMHTIGKEFKRNPKSFCMQVLEASTN